MARKITEKAIYNFLRGLDSEIAERFDINFTYYR